MTELFNKNIAKYNALCFIVSTFKNKISDLKYDDKLCIEYYNASLAIYVNVNI